MTTDPRLIVSEFRDFPIVTYQRDEHRSVGTWSFPKVTELIFADNTHDGSPVTYRHGPLGGEQTPVQLIFWGDWWNNAGSGQRGLIESRTQALLASRYFAELSQYNIGGAPAWRGSVTVSAPAPPLGVVDSNVAMRRVLNLIEERIDDGLFPDPDDGPRIAFIVLMPQGFQASGANGAHSSDYTFDFPFDEDRYWAGWVRYFDPAVEDVELTLSTLGHELVEILTDPESDGWRRGLLGVPLDGEYEICDWSDSNVGGVARRQRAWVNDVRVQSYWSIRHGATVIPIDDDYAAQLKAKVSETNRKRVSSGKVVSDPAIRRACKTIPACCIADDEYEFVEYSVSETARVRLNTVRYKDPRASWTIHGISVTGAGTVEVNIPVDGFNGWMAVSSMRSVKIGYVASDTVLDLTAVHPGGNFDLAVTCAVIDASITGNVATNVIATPSIVVGFVGAELLPDPAYIAALERCYTAMLDKFVKVHKPLGRPGPGDPINYDVTVLNRGLPAYARLVGYRQVRKAAKLIRAAEYLLETEDAQVFIGHLLRAQPALTRILHSGDGANAAEILRQGGKRPTALNDDAVDVDPSTTT